MLLGRIRTGRALVSILSACLYVPVAAQTVKTVDTAQESGTLRMVSRQEGEAIVQVAWELRRGLGPKPDCSHFVNAIYAQAGLDYEYARTQDVFEGIDSFRRVHRPQPGDLVVWQGHMGIVVDPDEHSFYSSVLSGFAIENYRSGYWMNRGQPRFYRYVIDEVHKARLAAHLTAPQLVPGPRQSGSVSGVSSNTDPDLRRSATISLPASERITQSASGDAEISDTVFVSSHLRPSREEVQAALIRLADANGDRLQQQAAMRPNQSIVVSDQVAVAELKVYDHSGWAELQIKETGSVRSRQGDLQPTERWRVYLHREERGWVMLVPQDRIYLRRGLAIRVLADQVAMMSRAPANDREIKKAVKALDDVLSRQISGPTAGLQ
jgi:hypothetical protein